MVPMTAQELTEVRIAVEKTLREQRNKPFTVSVMGQTGVGKSSLINALFNTDLIVDPVRPATREITPVQKIANGHKLIFYDMPGLGESDQMDAALIEKYRKQLIDSDVVLWAIHADTRSTASDSRTLQQLLEGITPEERQPIMSRITFVLTKADLLVQSAWRMGYADDYALFTPGKETKRLFDQKAQYYQEQLIHPYGPSIIAWTYNDVHFELNDPAFSYTEMSITHKGLLTETRLNELKQHYPHYAEVFKRLYDNYRVIPCSAFFKYNLVELMHIILNKLEPSVHESFKQVLNLDTLDHMPLDLALQRCNLYIVDVQAKATVFNLSESIFPDEKRGRRLLASNKTKRHFWQHWFQ